MAEGRVKCGRAAIRSGIAAAAATLLLGSAGCERDPNAPVGGAAGGGPSGPAEVSGDWSYTVPDLSGFGVTCEVSGVGLTFAQTDSTFTGTYSGGSVVCSAPGTPPDSGPFGSGFVVNGVVRGDSVIFDLDTPDYRNSGRLSGSSISGNARLRVDLGPEVGVFYLTGTFTAARE